MTTPSIIKFILAHLWITPAFLALAFDPLGIVYDVAKPNPHLARRAGTLGINIPAITKTGDSERPYSVDGNSFTDYESAAQRSCDIQFDVCQRAANTDSSVSFSLGDCQSQQNDCRADPPAVEDENASMTVASDDNSDSTESDTANSDTDSPGPTGSETTESQTTDSNTAESVATTDSGTTESDTAKPNPNGSEPGPILVSQTVLPYDSEFDLLCDL
ncbi:hypothetical protein ASPSYDRAFT_794100 [Aspergillus sydowii CBS 593.65]|uniref:Uncharacterized protein n=1 Tax=Aspergillus sydowii CBS 593.65 TaxID=1036612 RepID=A0A1L9TPC2_9EURO|nr:uncharacterized protein ASPSYDRAFT_794100 [Aspergillus sydowii CBS 593.65]OJJ61143.1 hypothetical protein ASPSYDRAFT_794100 [Aspergillus sydowii CBS 593.65]